MKEQIEARTLREGRYVLIDDEPCRIVSIDISKPGKHGAAKMKIEGIDIFTSNKRSMIAGSGDKVYAPMVDRRRAQVVSVHGEACQLMDMENYEMFDMAVPEEFKATLEAGKEIEFMEAMGKRMITKA